MSVPVTGPDGKEYDFPDGTDKAAAVSYFKKKGIGATANPGAALPGKNAPSMTDSPLMAYGKTFAKGVGKDVKNIVTDPVNLAMTAGSMIPATRIPTAIAAMGMGAKGVADNPQAQGQSLPSVMYSLGLSKNPPKATPDQLQGYLGGLAGIAGGAAGASTKSGQVGAGNALEGLKNAYVKHGELPTKVGGVIGGGLAGGAVGHGYMGVSIGAMIGKAAHPVIAKVLATAPKALRSHVFDGFIDFMHKDLTPSAPERMRLESVESRANPASKGPSGPVGALPGGKGALPSPTSTQAPSASAGALPGVKPPMQMGPSQMKALPPKPESTLSTQNPAVLIASLSDFVSKKLKLSEASANKLAEQWTANYGKTEGPATKRATKANQKEQQ